MRTFWFDAQTSSATGQNQTMECQLRLDPIDEVPITQPDDCTCYTKAGCSPGNSTEDSTTGDSTEDSTGDSSGDSSQGKIPRLEILQEHIAYLT